MRHSLFLGWALVLLTACTSGKQPSEPQNEAKALALPVSEKQLCLDWYTAFCNQVPDLELEDAPKPHQYIVADIDKDGLAEVLMQGVDSNKAAMLSYDQEGKVKYEDTTDDGYICLGIGDGWYVREHDDHMDEFRTFTKYYYKVADGKFDFIGTKETGFEGLDDEGEYICKENDGTNGQAPADSLLTMYYSMTEWKTISDDAKSEALSALNDGEPCEEDGDCECGEDEPEFFAAEVKLDNGTRLRVDYMRDCSGDISGFTTYYRSNGSTSKIPFFGTRYYDAFVDQYFVDVHEYYNGKCCGHMLWSLNDDNVLNSGQWFLGEKTLHFDTFEVKVADPEAEYTSPWLDFKVADQLLPCSRRTLKELFAKAYPESGPANYFMLVDVDSNGTFEMMVLNGFGNASKVALVWMEQGEPKVMGFCEDHNVKVHSSALLVTAGHTKSLYRWVNGVPRLVTETSMEEIEFFEKNSYELIAKCPWLPL